MRKLVYFVASTLDGYIAAPDGSWDFFVLEGDVIEYMVEHYPETLPTQVRRANGDTAPNRVFDTVLMGRHTYEPALRAGITSPYAHLTQIVFSRSIAPAPDPAVRVVADDPRHLVGRLRDEDGKDIWLAGGGHLAGQLTPLIDELVIKLNPVIAGAGIPLVTSGFDPHRFDLIDATPLRGGVVVLRYRAARGTT